MGRRKVLTVIQEISEVRGDGPHLIWKSKPVRVKEGDRFRVDFPEEYMQDGNMLEVLAMWHGMVYVMHTKWLRSIPELAPVV